MYLSQRRLKKQNRWELRDEAALCLTRLHNNIRVGLSWP
jgi:hypothetical protein